MTEKSPESQLAILIPTYNEAGNIPILLRELVQALDPFDYEIIVIDDDSPDLTWQIVQNYGHLAPGRISVIRRVGRRGLSSAVIEGILATDAEFFCVMDGDLQHDVNSIAALFQLGREGMDVVVASRYNQAGGFGEWSRLRQGISRVATKISNWIIRHDLSDPMSGFFLMRRAIALNKLSELSGKGFKILLDIISTYPKNELSIAEVPFVFKTRLHGKSKLNIGVMMQLGEFLYNKVLGRYIPFRFIKFLLTGSLGATAHLGVIYLFLPSLGYNQALIIAIEVAIVINFYINNSWTFFETSLSGLGALFVGLLKFNLFSLAGALISYAISTQLFVGGFHWVAASLLGALVASLWNYNLNRIFTWSS